MAEGVAFLIYNKEHWTKSATKKQIDSWPEGKFDAVYERGDIVEVQPLDFYDKGFDKSAFAVVKDKDRDIKNVENLAMSTFHPLTGKILYKRKGSITGVIYPGSQSVEISNVTITDKADLG